MTNGVYKTQYRGGRISLACIALCAVLMLVLSQVLILRLPDTVTMLFRPALVLVLIFDMLLRGTLRYGLRGVTFAAAVWMGVVLLLNELDTETVKYAAGVVMYMLMFWAVIGVAWNKRELRCIIAVCFVSCFVCAAALLYSNPITDFSVAANGHLQLLGMRVNRNKNAYVFAIGVVLGLIYLAKGRNIPRLLVLAMTAVTGYALLYSQCRGAFFCTVAAVFVLVGSQLLVIYRRNPTKSILYGLLFAAACVGAYYLLKNSELSRLVDGDSMSGRDDGIRYAWELYLGTDWFGKIFGSGFMYESRNTEGIGAHLVYVNFILSSGIIGVLFIVMILLLTLKRVKGGIPTALFMLAFVKTFFEGMEYNLYTALILSVVTYNYTLTYGGRINDLFSRR